MYAVANRGSEVSGEIVYHSQSSDKSVVVFLSSATGESSRGGDNAP